MEAYYVAFNWKLIFVAKILVSYILKILIALALFELMIMAFLCLPKLN